MLGIPKKWAIVSGLLPVIAMRNLRMSIKAIDITTGQVHDMIFENELTRIELNQRNHPDDMLDAEDALLLAWVQFNQLPRVIQIKITNTDSAPQKIKVKCGRGVKVKITGTSKSQKIKVKYSLQTPSEPGRFYELYRDCYLREAKAMIQGKHWEGKNRCVKLPGDE